MRNFKIFILLFAMILPFMASAQKPGYSPYECVGYVNNGQRTNGSGSIAWTKFDGNLIFLNPVGGAYPDLRFRYSETQSNGTLVYYQQAYNVGGMGTPSGWMDNRNSWLLVSPDKSTINYVTQFGNNKNVTIYKIQTASSAGDMIY